MSCFSFTTEHFLCGCCKAEAQNGNVIIFNESVLFFFVVSILNFQTIDNETPLHCAAQHGHTGALTTLLAHGANPNMVNSRGEKPLDLAAQYGRLQVVQMLVRAHPELIHPYKKYYNDKKRAIHTHTPLHLAGWVKENFLFC